jgi:GntR family transcriptional regulator
VIEFRLDRESGLAPYQQLMRQVRQAMRLGLLREGDRLPPVKEVAGGLPVNQNTVLKAYRELACDVLVDARPGVGTFVRVTLAESGVPAPLGEELTRWLAAARAAGLDEEGIEALFGVAVRATR